MVERPTGEDAESHGPDDHALVDEQVGSRAARATVVAQEPHPADPLGTEQVAQLVPAGSVWLYVGVVAFAAVLVYAGTLLPTWLQLRRRPLEAVVFS